MTYRYGPHTEMTQLVIELQMKMQIGRKRPISSFQKILKTKDYGTKKNEVIERAKDDIKAIKVIILQNKQLLT